MSNITDNLERFEGMDAKQILAELKKEREKASLQEQVRENYSKLGIAPTKNGDKVMIKLEGSYAVTQTKKGWIALQKLIPLAIQACDDLGVSDAPAKDEKAA